MQRLTYLNEQLVKGKILRWHANAFPLPVFIDNLKWYSMPESERFLYKHMVIQAFKEWETVGQGKFSFIIVDSQPDSFINVGWRRVNRKSLGDCSYNYDENSILYSAEVSIGISDGIISKKYMDEAEVYHTILHEIGHALGLGHSPNKGDIMYTPHQYGQTKLSARDINSVRFLYTFPPSSNLESLNSMYSIDCKDIDDVVMQISGASKLLNKTGSEHKKPIQQGRNLQDEQDKLAQIKKFQMSLQNVKLPSDMLNKFKDR